MQYRPSSAELLEALAELLQDVLLPELPENLQHRARVGANLARMLGRELELAPPVADREQPLPAADESELARWQAMVEVVRADLAVAKPGYDAWEGE
ncbi:hypothetical protein [Nocardia mexicana]|uniref:Uncharacterized protein n=1 Tax=Nocardia mexicana TaxID=279262 RepID=A0A370HG04_9NOCA|nr:hypothetical protein [Nocardia mexicana]RDI55680.1 hypothetical protein DFR68_101514 [Nocardia mexicana]